MPRALRIFYLGTSAVHIVGQPSDVSLSEYSLISGGIFKDSKESDTVALYMNEMRLANAASMEWMRQKARDIQARDPYDAGNIGVTRNINTMVSFKCSAFWGQRHYSPD